jgi:hypothetical protein
LVSEQKEIDLKARIAPRRKIPARDVIPPEVPEASSLPEAVHKPEPAEEIPDHIRKMLEAAYT